MSSDLSPADITRRRRLTDIRLAAASQLGCALDQQRHWGWYDRSLSGRATRAEQTV